MDRNSYQKAFNALSFSPDFQERTGQMLRERVQSAGKEKNMTFKRSGRTVFVAAAVVAALAASVMAAVLTYSPARVAKDIFDEPRLAAAFQSEGAIVVNQTATVGGYEVTFVGLTPGSSLTSERLWINGELVTDSIYAIFAYKTENKTAYWPNLAKDLTNMALLKGRSPKEFAFGGYSEFVREGDVTYSFYRLPANAVSDFQISDLYFAVAPRVLVELEDGTMRDTGFDAFSEGEDGTLTLNEGADGAIFSITGDYPAFQQFGNTLVPESDPKGERSIEVQNTLYIR